MDITIRQAKSDELPTALSLFEEAALKLREKASISGNIGSIRRLNTWIGLKKVLTTASIFLSKNKDNSRVCSV